MVPYFIHLLQMSNVFLRFSVGCHTLWPWQLRRYEKEGQHGYIIRHGNTNRKHDNTQDKAYAPKADTTLRISEHGSFLQKCQH